MKNKNRVTNVNPYHVDIKIHSEGFSIWFYDTFNDDYSRRKIFKIHFKDWWLKVIANLLWKVVKQRRNDITELEHGMTER